MSMVGLLAEYPKPTKEQVQKHFDGNICRCTGEEHLVQETAQEKSGR